MADAPERYALHHEDETHLETNPHLSRVWHRRGEQATLPAVGSNRRLTNFGSVDLFGRGRVEVLCPDQTSASFLLYLQALDERHAATAREVDRALEGLLASNKRALWLFSNYEPLYDELVRSGWADRLAGSPNMTFAHIAVRDHTMRPSWCQRQVHAALDRVVQLELERTAAPAVPSR